MKTLLLHVTDLDSWIWYKKIESMPAKEMIGRLLRTEPPNDNMKRGTAWHSILENPPDEITTVERDGYTFRVECDAEIVLPQVREIRATKNYFIDGIIVTLTGKCDGISGNEVSDHKLTFRPNPENYFDSRQWRAYLDIFDADVFKYILYSAKEKKGEVVIWDVSPMKMYAYPDMENDLTQSIHELVQFIKVHVPQMIEES